MSDSPSFNLPFLKSDGPATKPSRHIQDWELLSLGYRGQDVMDTDCSEDQLKAALRTEGPALTEEFLQGSWNSDGWGAEQRKAWADAIKSKGFHWLRPEDLRLNGQHALVKVWCRVYRPSMFWWRWEKAVFWKLVGLSPKKNLTSALTSDGDRTEVERELRRIWEGEWLGWKEAYSWLFPKQVEFWMCLKCSMEARAVWPEAIAWRTEMEEKIAQVHWGQFDKIDLKWQLGGDRQRGCSCSVNEPAVCGYCTGKTAFTAFRIPETELDVLTFRNLDLGAKTGEGVDSWPLIRVVDNGDAGERGVSVVGKKLAEMRPGDAFYAEYATGAVVRRKRRELDELERWARGKRAPETWPREHIGEHRPTDQTEVMQRLPQDGPEVLDAPRLPDQVQPTEPRSKVNPLPEAMTPAEAAKARRDLDAQSAPSETPHGFLAAGRWSLIDDTGVSVGRMKNVQIRPLDEAGNPIGEWKYFNSDEQENPWNSTICTPLDLPEEARQPKHYKPEDPAQGEIAGTLGPELGGETCGGSGEDIVEAEWTEPGSEPSGSSGN